MATLVGQPPPVESPLVTGVEHIPVPPTSLVVFGATGDLAHRKLLPAIYNLAHDGALPDRFELIGVARSGQPREDFREMARESITRFSRRAPDPDVLDGLLAEMHYVPGVFDDDGVYAEIDRVLRECDDRAGEPLNRVFYLSTAPQFFPLICAKLGAAGLHRCERAQTRIVIEKPFGFDLASARELNACVLDVFDESQVFRIDHYLGKETVQNLMALRFANALFEPVWNRNFVDHVQITAAEQIGIEGRADYYEQAGALRDLVQNHLLQLLALLTMEPPAAFEADRVRDEKVKVLEAIEAPSSRGRSRDGGAGAVRSGRGGRCSGPGLPAGAGRGPGFAYRDLRGASPLRLELALGGRAVLPADGQASGTEADRNRGDPQARAAPCVPGRGLPDGRPQPDRPDGAARRGGVGQDRGEDPGPADADPPGQHGVQLRHLVRVAVAGGVRASDPRRDARRRDAVHARRRSRGTVADHRPDPRRVARGCDLPDPAVPRRVAGAAGGGRFARRWAAVAAALIQTPVALVLAPLHQHYLREARQMQALSFAVHIPLVCFAIAFPAMVLFVESRYLRTGDELYRTLARRWSKIVVALFAVGVVSGTILSFEMGLLWPGFMATFGSVFGLGFAIEGFSFFTEAIFIGIYVYGWDRLSPRTHFLTGIPVAIAGFTGSLMVISVNAWMQHPGGFKLRGGKVVDVHPLAALFGNSYLWHELVHMYVAGYIVAGFLLAAAYAVGRLRGRWGRYERTAFAIPLTIAALASPVQVLVGDWAGRDVATSQPIKLAAIEGLYRTTRGAPEHLLGWYTGHQVKYGIEIPHVLSLLAFHSWNATVRGLDTVAPADRPPVNVVRVSFQLMVANRHAARVAGNRVRRDPGAAQATAGLTLVLPSGGAGRARVGGGADRRLGDDRGGAPAVGCLPRDAHFPGGHRRERDTRRLRHAGSGLPRSCGRGGVDPAPARPGAAGDQRRPSTQQGCGGALSRASLRRADRLRPDRPGAVHGAWRR